MKRELFVTNRYKKAINHKDYTLETELDEELDTIRNFTINVDKINITNG